MSHLFSLSTSWNISRYRNPEDYVRELDEMGFDKVEVNYEVSKEFVKDIMPYVEKGKLHVRSVHNICPAPIGYSNMDSILPLSSTDEELRKLVVNFTKNTLDTAARFGAKVVVLHIGEVDGIAHLNDMLRDMFSRGEDKTEKFAEVRDRIIKERKNNKSSNVEACEKSIYELSDYIYKKDYQIKLGLENRDRYHQIPILEEYEKWFDKFKEYPIGLWYDIGHGEVHKNVFLESCVPILERYKDYILGFHIHDTDGISDHYAPGMKKTEFNQLRDFLNLNVIRVFELKPYVSKEDVIRGVEYFKKQIE